MHGVRREYVDRCFRGDWIVGASTPSNLLLSLIFLPERNMLWISSYFLDFIGSNLDSVE